MTQSFNKATFYFFIKIILTAGVVYWLSKNLNINHLLMLLEKTSWSITILCVISLWLGLSLATKRWAYVIEFKSNVPSFFEIWRQTMLGFFLSQFSSL